MTTDPESSLLLPDALAVLGRHRPGSPGAPLDSALAQIEDTLADPEFAIWDEDTKAYVWLLAGVAATFRHRSDRSCPDDLDRAVQWLGLAGGSARWQFAATVNLAAALTDRYERDRDPADLDEALRRLPAALDGLREVGARMDIGLHILGLAKAERYAARGDPADLAEAVTAYRDALACPQPDADERAGYLNSLGLALRADGRPREAAAAFSSARDLVDWPAIARRDSTINLAALLLDSLYRSDADPAHLATSISLHREAFDYLQADRGQHFATVPDNLGIALVYQYRLTGQLDCLREAADHFQETVAAHQPDNVGAATAVSGFALVLIETYERSARVALLDHAIALYEGLVGEPATRTAERCQALGVCLMKRFVHTDSRFDLDRAIRLLAEAADKLTMPADRADALNSEANAWSLRFLETRDPDDSDRALDRAARAVADAPSGSIEATMYRSNLGNMFLRRFEFLGEHTALERAISEQRAALAGLTQQATPPAVALAALADSLAARTQAFPGEAEAREASAAFRHAVEATRRSVPAQSLAAAERWGKWAAARSAWGEAVEAYQQGLRALHEVVSTQQGRQHKETWLRQANTVPVDGAAAMLRTGLPRQAVAALEQGRAVLLSENLPLTRATIRSPAYTKAGMPPPGSRRAGVVGDDPAAGPGGATT